MSDLSGSIPVCVFHGKILSEFRRITKFTSKLSDFVLKAKQLYNFTEEDEKSDIPLLEII